MIANIETAFATVLKLSEVTIYNVNDTGNLETIAQSLLKFLHQASGRNYGCSWASTPPPRTTTVTRRKEVVNGIVGHPLNLPRHFLAWGRVVITSQCSEMSCPRLPDLKQDPKHHASGHRQRPPRGSSFRYPHGPGTRNGECFTLFLIVFSHFPLSHLFSVWTSFVSFLLLFFPLRLFLVGIASPWLVPFHSFDIYNAPDPLDDLSIAE